MTANYSTDKKPASPPPIENKFRSSEIQRAAAASQLRLKQLKPCAAQIQSRAFVRPAKHAGHNLGRGPIETSGRDRQATEIRNNFFNTAQR